MCIRDSHQVGGEVQWLCHSLAILLDDEDVCPGVEVGIKSWIVIIYNNEQIRFGLGLIE